MRTLLLALFCAGGLAGAAAAANNDLVELGVGARLLFNADVYAADNPGVDYATDVFPIVGDEAFGLGLNVALGHRFDSRRGPYEVLVKYYYSTGSEDSGTRAVGGSTPATYDIVGTLDQHDLLMSFRLPGELMPVPVLNYHDFYYDLGMGVTTLSYKFDRSNATTGALLESSRRTRSGLAFNVGAGWRHALSENTALTLRADFVLGKIQDVKDASGQVVQLSPNAHGARFQLGLVRYFRSLF
jgi:hypothetical protein